MTRLGDALDQGRSGPAGLRDSVAAAGKQWRVWLEVVTLHGRCRLCGVPGLYAIAG